MRWRTFNPLSVRVSDQITAFAIASQAFLYLSYVDAITQYILFNTDAVASDL